MEECDFPPCIQFFKTILFRILNTIMCHSSRKHSLLFTTSTIALLYHLSPGRNIVRDDSLNPEPADSPAACDLFSGRWVYDDESYPLYKEQECSFMADDYACRRYGRNEFKFQHWRWQPHHCDLPRFNATTFLEKIRGKRVVFVGDSLNKNQWMSLLCLLDSSIPPSSKSNIWKGSLITFQAFGYNVTIDFYWEPLLVESNCDDPINHHVLDRIIRVGSIEKHAKHWNDADILIFDSFKWWLEPKMTLLWGSFDSPDGVYKKVEMKLRRYEMAIRAWTDWLDMQINRSKTKIFFTSLSASHKTDEDWRKSGGSGNCYGETEPITDEGYMGSGIYMGMMKIVENAIEELRGRGLHVEYLNITQLTDYRKDAHPSIYRRQWTNLTQDQLSDPRTYADCVHWCLPGVPDVWNQILYSYVMDLNW